MASSLLLVLTSVVSVIQFISCQAEPGYAATYNAQPDEIIINTPQNFVPPQYSSIYSAGNNNAGFSNTGINTGLSNLGINNNRFSYNGINNNGFSGLNNGGGFNVISSSPLAPTGISVLGENLAMDGSIAVSGNMPFASTVALEGNVQTNGEGSVKYNCGNEARLSNAGNGIGLTGPAQFQNTGFGNLGQQNFASFGNAAVGNVGVGNVGVGNVGVGNAQLGRSF